MAIEAYKSFLTDAKENRKTSTDTTIGRLRRFFSTPALPLWTLTEAKCQELYDALVPVLTPSSHRGILSETKTFLNWCAKRGFCEGNPAAKVEGVGRRRHGKLQPSAADQDLWLECALALGHEGDEGAIAALLAYNPGMRATEIRTRLVRHFDPERMTMRITDAKTDAGNRTEKLDPEISQLLDELCEGRDPDAPIFHARLAADGFHEKEWVTAQVRRVCDIAGVRWEIDGRRIGAHSMRGALASVASEAGIPLEVIRKVLGQKDTRVTRRSYALPGTVERGERARGLRVVRGGREE